ncbi:MAG: 50S ribosomal protein L11 methyltransferase [Pseudomonadota bacterium]
MHQLRIQTNASAVERVEELLFNCGAVSISYLDAEDEPILEPPIGDHPLWSSLYIQAHFVSEEEIKLASKALFNETAVGSQIIVEQIRDEGWQEKFQQQFNAMQFGDLWIYPSWEDNPAPQGLSIQLDPGLAFGTGHHPTTHLCLCWLSQTKLDDLDIIDFGCGSGILALAAALLNANHVYAVDIDPQAITATHQNIEKNHLANRFFTIGNINILDNIHADMIIANILAAPLFELRDKFAQHLKPSGVLLVSGILNDQVDSIIQHYTTNFIHLDTSSNQGWSAISFMLR